MTPEQREELKQAAQQATKGAWEQVTSSFNELASPEAILSLIAQVEALTVPQGAITPMDKETLDEKALNALLWFYRRAENAYGRLPFAEEAITGLRARIAAPTIPAIPGTKEDAT